jgi:outer membrane biosynthesis protein TonB
VQIGVIETMIDEEEAFWAGIAVATMMLGGGFSMLFLQTFTGFGAVVLALGLMTMALTIQTRARSTESIKPNDAFESCVTTSSRSIDASRETVKSERELQPSQTEDNKEQSALEHPVEQAEVSPTSQAQQAEPSEPTQPQATQSEQPTQPEPPVQETTETPKEDKKPEERPIILVEA